jgi:hypothetical protein
MIVFLLMQMMAVSFASDRNIRAAPAKLIYDTTSLDNFMRPVKQGSDLNYHHWLSMQMDEAIDSCLSMGNHSNSLHSMSSDEFSTQSTECFYDNKNPLPPSLPWRPPQGDGLLWHSSEPIPPHLWNVSVEMPDSSDVMFYRQPMTPVETLLLKIDLICEKANCTATVPDQIIQAIREAVEDGIDFKKQPIPKYATFLKHIQKRFPCTQPETIPVTLESPFDDMFSEDNDCSPNGPQSKKQKKTAHKISNVHNDLTYNRTEVIRFPFLKQAEDILSDHTLFSNLRNFDGVINPDDPFGMFGPTDGSLDDIVSGEWYRNTYRQALDIQESHYPREPICVIPVILYMDKTGLDKMNRIAMEPLVMMLGILNRKARNQDHAKRLLGYIPDLELKSSAEKQVQRNGPSGKGRSCRNYHKVLSVITTEISGSQGYTSRIVGYIRIGNQVQLRRLFFPLAFVIGDGKSSDMLAQIRH